MVYTRACTPQSSLVVRSKGQKRRRRERRFCGMCFEWAFRFATMKQKLAGRSGKPERLLSQWVIENSRSKSADRKTFRRGVLFPCLSRNVNPTSCRIRPSIPATSSCFLYVEELDSMLVLVYRQSVGRQTSMRFLLDHPNDVSEDSDGHPHLEPASMVRFGMIWAPSGRSQVKSNGRSTVRWRKEETPE
jgi:hypothetical protein